MRIWPVIAATGFSALLGFWVVRSESEVPGITVQWRGQGWASATSPMDGRTQWNRGVLLKNEGNRDFVGEVHCFVGDSPNAAWLQKVSAEASRAIDLSPGESVSTGVWVSDKPVGKISAVIFLTNTSDLRDRVAFRTRYPLFRALRPLPLKFVEMPE